MDYSFPALNYIVSNSESDLQDDASAELAQLLDLIKSLKEQQARTDKVLADSAHGVAQTVAWNKRLDELQAENRKLEDERDFYQDAYHHLLLA